ncbi:MAG: O-methyltransferase, partial [Actinomycetota bacterium]
LEIGTLGGYSTICLARALPEEGRLISLEISEHHAGVARRNIERAGLSSRVEVRLGNAKRLLAELAESGEDPFDLVFIDADKEGYPEYLEWSIRLSRPGTVILADNTIRGGSVLDPHDASSRAMREFNERLARDERLSATIVPMLRERVDGLAVARVIDL